MLEIQAIEAFDDNYIWLLSDPTSKQAFVVDPGDASPVNVALQAADLSLVGVLITHHHFDHVGGLKALCDEHAPIVYGPDNPAIDGITQPCSAGDTVEVLGETFEVLEVPGHTLDHIAYYRPGTAPCVFCGDTLFAGGCGRIFEGTPEMMLASLQRLAALPTQTQVYCAHEYTLANLSFAQAVEADSVALQDRVAAAQASRERGEPTVPSTLALELATNPFLRCTEPTVRDALEAQGRPFADDETSVFAQVRGWKDNF